MSAAAFEFNLSFPREPRYLAMLRDVVVSAARQTGCTEDAARTFAQEVEGAAASAPTGAGQTPLDVTVRHTDGVMEVRVGSGAEGRSLTVRA